jgi:hypothetical protein
VDPIEARATSPVCRNRSCFYGYSLFRVQGACRRQRCHCAARRISESQRERDGFLRDLPPRWRGSRHREPGGNAQGESLRLLPCHPCESKARCHSDGDGFPNEAEFLKGTNPGTPESNPSAGIASNRIYTATQISKMSQIVNATVFINTTKSKSGDSCNEYPGNEVFELLQAMGITNAADSVDFISLDGYKRIRTMAELKKTWKQGRPVLGLSKEALGPCGWVHYNASGLDAGVELPGVSLLPAFEENRKKLENARFDPETGRIIGARGSSSEECLIGAIYLVPVETLARISIEPEIPIGILTAMVGAPVFASLLRKNRPG